MVCALFQLPVAGCCKLYTTTQNHNVSVSGIFHIFKTLVHTRNILQVLNKSLNVNTLWIVFLNYSSTE